MDNLIQKQVFRAMEKPLFYPHPVSGIRQKETHISKVFLTGEYVYKIKKSVDFGFLDFSTLEKRRYYCCREIILNRRLTCDTYLDVVAITRSNDMIVLGGKGQVVEYAVRMRRLSDSKSLRYLIKTGEISKVDMPALGRLLARFYLRTAKSELLHTGEGWKSVYNACKENFRQTQDSCNTLLDKKTWEIVQGATLSFLKNHPSYFNHRFKTGKIRDCHGDLRCEHIYFTDTGIQIIDCIEFNDYLRHIDVISDLAFLLMDLDFNEEPGLGDCLLNEFLQHTNDLKAFLMLAFYKCYRAVVRCKVNIILLRSHNLLEGERKSVHLNAIKYLDLAFQYALQFYRPRMWVVCGMPATGKSTIAKQLSKTLEIKIIRSDAVRKEIFGLQPHENGVELFGEKIYSSLATSLTYGKLLCLAQAELETGTSVILDATYSRAKYRREVINLAKDKGIKPIFIECSAKEKIMKERLLERKYRPSVSDARIDHFEELDARYERFRYAGNALHIRVNTALPLEDVMRKILIRAFQLDSNPLINIPQTELTMV
ncbi:MAG: AAA family ATPase [Desulfobacula sp.]|nr:AAA family ATPase [Desulfobacula sp.]